MGNLLKMDHITMQFGGVVAVNDLNLEVNQGEIVALIGPNGAGKTTAFNCVTGIYEPTNGRIIFEGREVLASCPRGKMKKLYSGDYPAMDIKPLVPTPDKLTEIGIARTFQNIRLFHQLSVFENVLIAKHMRAKQNVFSAIFRLNHREEERMRREAEELLKMQGLWAYKDDIASSLPYGLQRRLEIARALATQPKLLLLDEPAAGMNPNETKELMKTISFIRDKFKIAILLIEHDMDLVMGICERLYVLNFGKIIASGLPSEIQSNKEVIAAYLGE